MNDHRESEEIARDILQGFVKWFGCSQFTLPEQKELTDIILSALLQHQARGEKEEWWVLTAERAPTQADGNRYGNVFTLCGLQPWNDVKTKYWMPIPPLPGWTNAGNTGVPQADVAPAQSIQASELLPCPFCGGEVAGNRIYGGGYSVRCVEPTCRADVFLPTPGFSGRLFHFSGPVGTPQPKKRSQQLTQPKAPNSSKLNFRSATALSQEEGLRTH